jgi:homoaconitate hydratase
MGSREAQAYLASPPVVAASAVAGRIASPTFIGAGPEPERDPPPAHRPEKRYETFETPGAEEESVEILPGFPETVSGRLVLLPADNLNTDGIYSKDYTYREGMTKEDMARVVMENYDPEFPRRTREGDILVGGWNFGTGSSREQAATALQARGIALVLAGSFSQTYLRNAYNNGFICIECSSLVTRLREMYAPEIEAGEATIIPGGALAVDFARGTVEHEGEIFRFPPLGTVPQRLVVVGGSENLVRRKLGLDD